MSPDHIKSKKGEHCSITLTCNVLCFSTWLQLAVHHYSAAGRPVTNHITRPLQVGSQVFAEKATSSSNVWARLVKQLKELGMYQGQSVHNTIRAMMIHKQHQACFLCKRHAQKLQRLQGAMRRMLSTTLTCTGPLGTSDLVIVINCRNLQAVQTNFTPCTPPEVVALSQPSNCHYVIVCSKDMSTACKGQLADPCGRHAWFVRLA